MLSHAVVFTEPNTVVYQEVETPDPGPDQAVIRLTHSWISNGTEGSFLRGERIDGDTAYREGDPWPFPMVAGYQRIGVVEWIGKNIEDLEIGETVFSVVGSVNGMFMPRGGQVSPSVTARGAIWKLPEACDSLAFSGMVLTQVGYNCGVRAPINIGDGAVVVGDGLVGQWAAQTLAWRGAEVVLVGRHDDRLNQFTGRAGRAVINSRNMDPVEELKRRFPDGVQVLVDTIGSTDMIAHYMTCMKKYGHIVSAGFYGTEDRLALQPPRYQELSIDLVSGLTPDRMDQTLALIANDSLETLPLITHHFPVSAAAKAWQLIESKSEPVLGVILDW